MLSFNQFKKCVSKGRSVSFVNLTNRKFYVYYHFSSDCVRMEYFNKDFLRFSHSAKLNLSSVADVFILYRSASIA